MAVTGKQTNRIPFSSSCPLESIASNIRQYMTFAVLPTGNPVNALGNGIHGGNGVSIVINSKFIRCVPPFSLLVWINNGGIVAQSTVTNRIHELEKELNIALFTRNNRSVELTCKQRQAVRPSLPKGGEYMPITLTFHLFGLTFTIRVKK